MNVTCINTIASLEGVFNKLFAKKKDITIKHIYDGEIIPQLERENGFTKSSYYRLENLLRRAEKNNPDVILITCSSLSRAVDKVSSSFKTKIFTIDEGMIEYAVRNSSNITVLATAESTLMPTKASLLKEAERVHKDISIKLELVPNALSELKKGNLSIHDTLVKDYVDTLENIDLLVLAQASMAHLEVELSGNGYPVISSPKMAVKKVIDYLERG